MTRYCQDIEIVGTADGVVSGIACIQMHNPDLVMLDVQLQDGTGFELLSGLESRDFKLIFTTAHNEYAIRAFKFSATDYLLKPIDIEELELAVQRVHEDVNVVLADKVDHLLDFSTLDPSLTISTEQTLEILPVAEIIRIESNGSYSLFVLSNGDKVVSSKNLKYYEFLSDEYAFLRVHNSHIIHLKFVKRVLRKDGGFVEMTNGDLVPLSRRRKDLFLSIYLKK
jgi:two-component system LytT family response regulator